jgi:hypothetical protein
MDLSCLRKTTSPVHKNILTFSFKFFTLIFNWSKINLGTYGDRTILFHFYYIYCYILGFFYYYCIEDYIVTFTKVLTIYHSLIHSLHQSPLSSLSPHSWNIFNRSHFSIFIHENTIFPPYSPPFPFPYKLPIPLVLFPGQDLFYLPALCFWKNIFCLFKVFIQGVSLWYFHVYMYYNPNWFIPFIFLFLLSILIPFLWWFQQI